MIRPVHCLWATALVLVCSLAWGIEREGSSWTDLQKLKPPPPSEISVIVLPFWAKGQTQSEMVRGAVLLNLCRHGFKVVPDSGTLSGAARATDKLVDQDRLREPGTRADRQLAARVGKAANAAWAIYGEVEELRTDVSHLIIGERKTGTIDARLVLVSVETGDIIYWTRVKAIWASKVYTRKGSSIERKMAQDAVAAVFEDIGKALPVHEVGPEVSQDDIQKYIRDMGL